MHTEESVTVEAAGATEQPVEVEVTETAAPSGILQTRNDVLRQRSQKYMEEVAADTFPVEVSEEPPAELVEDEAESEPETASDIMAQTVKATINGRAVEMTVQEAVRRAGINEAAELGLQQARESQREAERLLEQARSVAPNVSEESIQALLDAYLEDDSMNAAQFSAKLRNVSTQPEPAAPAVAEPATADVNAMVENEFFRRDYQTAYAALTLEDPAAADILDIGTPVGQLADRISVSVMNERPGIPMNELLAEVVSRTREEGARMFGAPAPAALPARAPNHSRRQAYVQPAPVAPQAPSDPMASAASAIDKMRRGRAGHR